MRLRLDAEPEELLAKGGVLLDTLAHALDGVHPELAEALHKAALEAVAQPHLQYPVTEQLRAEFVAAYEKQVQAMLRDIGRVLDHAGTQLDKSLEPA